MHSFSFSKDEQIFTFDTLELDNRNLVLLGSSDVFIVLCNARIIELYINSQYECSKKGIKLCEICNNSGDIKYFYVLMSSSRRDKVEIKVCI